MSNQLPRISKLFLIGGIVASMGFGAREAVAAKATAPCYDPPTWLGECASEAECDTRCVIAGGFEGECKPNGCCACAYF